MAEATAQKGVLWWAFEPPAPPPLLRTPTTNIHLAAQGPSGGATSAWDPSPTSTRRRTTTASRTSAGFPELRFLNRHDWIAPVDLRAVVPRSSWVAGPGLVVGFFWSTVLLWHSTFPRELGARARARPPGGTRPTTTSRNSLVIALLTGGEGWHNNHHHYQASARQGFFWWGDRPPRGTSLRGHELGRHRARTSRCPPARGPPSRAPRKELEGGPSAARPRAPGPGVGRPGQHGRRQQAGVDGMVGACTSRAGGATSSARHAKGPAASGAKASDGRRVERPGSGPAVSDAAQHARSGP